MQTIYTSMGRALAVLLTILSLEVCCVLSIDPVDFGKTKFIHYQEPNTVLMRTDRSLLMKSAKQVAMNAGGR